MYTYQLFIFIIRLKRVLEIEPLKKRSVRHDEAPLCILGNFGIRFTIPQNDGGQGCVCFSTNTDIHIIFNLPIQNIGVRALGCQKQMDAKSTSCRAIVER